MNTRSLGSKGEDMAAQYLLSKGFEIITRNYGTGIGEIDLVSRDPENSLVFVEVKYAQSLRSGDPAWKISPSKIKTIGRVAQQYLKEHSMENTPFRIDAVTISPNGIDHFRNCI